MRTTEVLVDGRLVEWIIKATLTRTFGPVKPITQRDINATAGDVLLYVRMKHNMTIFDGLFYLCVTVYAQRTLQISHSLYEVSNR